MSETWLTSDEIAIVIVIAIAIAIAIALVIGIIIAIALALGLMSLEHTIERNEGQQIVLRDKTKSSGDHWLADATQRRFKIRGIGK
jgi:hypothetical protein